MDSAYSILKKILIFIVILAAVLWSVVFFLDRVDAKKEKELLNEVQHQFDAVNVKAYDGENPSILVEITIEDEEEIYTISKKALPYLVENGYLEGLAKYKELVVNAKIVDANTGEKLDSQSIVYPINKISLIEWDKIQNFDTLLNYVSLLST